MEQSSDPDIFISLFNERLFIIDHFASILCRYAAHRGSNDKPMNKRRARRFMRSIRMDQQRSYLGLRSSSRSGRIDNLRYVAIENLSRVSLCLTIVDLDRLIFPITSRVVGRNKGKLGNREVRSIDEFGRVEKVGLNVLATNEREFNNDISNRECNSVPRKYRWLSFTIYYLSETFNHLVFVIIFYQL